MKNLLRLLFSILIITTLSCHHDDDIGPSQIDTSEAELSDLDTYLRDSFAEPYNIEIQYKWNINETEESRILYPPHVESVKPMAQALKKVWIDTYSEVAGKNFIKKLAPRMFTFVGSFNYNKSNTFLLGLAEAGAKISLFNIDFIDYSDYESIRRPMHTIQHEYIHILNQNKPFNTDFNDITPAGYTAQWFNMTDGEANEAGFITNYASSDPTEDFAEMASIMLTRSEEEYEDLLDGIESSDAVTAIEEKESMVREYFLKEYDIDFDELREVAFQHLLEATTEE